MSGCKCFNCARLGGCPYANASIKACKKFVKCKFTVVEAAHILGCDIKVLTNLRDKAEGRRYLLSKFRSMGYELFIDTENHNNMYIKLPFDDSLGKNAWKISDQIMLAAQ